MQADTDKPLLPQECPISVVFATGIEEDLLFNPKPVQARVFGFLEPSFLEPRLQPPTLYEH